MKLFDQPRALPSFSLQQSDGTQLVPGELKGHWTLVFLGFTHCPDVCPTTLAQLAQAQKQWRALPDSIRPRVLFVSVDPERDTPDAHRRIRARFPSRHAGGHRRRAGARSLRAIAVAGVHESAGAGRARLPSNTASTTRRRSPCSIRRARMAGVIQPPLDPKAIAADLLALTQGAAR